MEHPSHDANGSPIEQDGDVTLYQTDTAATDMSDAELMAVALHDASLWQRRQAIHLLIHRARLDEIRATTAAHRAAIGAL